MDPKLHFFSCIGCGQIKPIKERKRCSRCKMVGYCSEDCQKKDWPEHKKKCEKMKASTPNKAVVEKLAGFILKLKKEILVTLFQLLLDGSNVLVIKYTGDMETSKKDDVLSEVLEQSLTTLPRESLSPPVQTRIVTRKTAIEREWLPQTLQKNTAMTFVMIGSIIGEEFVYISPLHLGVTVPVTKEKI